MFLGLRTVVYPAPDLAASKAWFTERLGVEPYFDEPFYVGFDVGGYELGLRPAEPGGAGPVTYWGVADADAALARLAAGGDEVVEPVRDVGGGIRLGAVREPGGAPLGVIENPHFGGGGRRGVPVASARDAARLASHPRRGGDRRRPAHRLPRPPRARLAVGQRVPRVGRAAARAR
jgi:predicted enzyme related to lactoylglutathione lyase